jgi:hypothetical protein
MLYLYLKHCVTDSVMILPMLVAILLHFQIELAAAVFNYHRFALERVFIWAGLWRFPQGERHLLCCAALYYARAPYTMRLKVEKILLHHGHCFHLEKIFLCLQISPVREMLLRLNRLNKVPSSTWFSIEIILSCAGVMAHNSWWTTRIMHCGLRIRIALFPSEILSEYL